MTMPYKKQWSKADLINKALDLAEREAKAQHSSKRANRDAAIKVAALIDFIDALGLKADPLEEVELQKNYRILKFRAGIN